MSFQDLRFRTLSEVEQYISHRILVDGESPSNFDIESIVEEAVGFESQISRWFFLVSESALLDLIEENQDYA